VFCRFLRQSWVVWAGRVHHGARNIYLLGMLTKVVVGIIAVPAFIFVDGHLPPMFARHHQYTVDIRTGLFLPA